MKTVRPSGPACGMRVSSSSPNSPVTTSAVPPESTMLAAISLRMSIQTPSVRGAAKACSCTAESPSTAVTPVICCSCSLISRRSSMPCGAAQPDGAEVEVVAVVGDLGAVERSGDAGALRSALGAVGAGLATLGLGAVSAVGTHSAVSGVEVALCVGVGAPVVLGPAPGVKSPTWFIRPVCCVVLVTGSLVRLRPVSPRTGPGRVDVTSPEPSSTVPGVTMDAVRPASRGPAPGTRAAPAARREVGPASRGRSRVGQEATPVAALRHGALPSGCALRADHRAVALLGELAAVVDEETPSTGELVGLLGQDPYRELLTGEVGTRELEALGLLGLVDVDAGRASCRPAAT